MRNTLSRLEALEREPEHGVVLYLENGGECRHPGPMLKTFMEASKQINEQRGPLYHAIQQTVGAKNFGRLWEVLEALL